MLRSVVRFHLAPPINSLVRDDIGFWQPSPRPIVVPTTCPKEAVRLGMAATRRRHFGSVRKLPSGRYQARYWHAGERYTSPETFAAKADASAWLSLQRPTSRGVPG